MDDVDRQVALERLKSDLKGLPSKRSLAWQEIQNGVNPRWVALKYGFPVEQMEAAAEEHRKRLESKESANRVARQE